MAATRVRGRGVGCGERASGARRGGTEALAVTLRYGTAAAVG